MVRAGQVQPGQLAALRPRLSQGNDLALQAAAMLGFNPSAQDVMAVIELLGLETEDGIFERLNWLVPRRRAGV